MSRNESVTVVDLQNAKELIKTISNNTSQLIIDYIKKNKGATATQIVKDLNIPASTVHYNISALVKAKILNDESFHYSSKGKIVSHYELSDQVIVIVPNSNKADLTTQLKTLLPGIFGLAAISVIWIISKIFNSPNISSSANLLDNMTKPLANRAVYETTSKAANICVSSSEPNTTAFLVGGVIIGVVAIIIGVFLYDLIVRKRKQV